MKRPLSVTILSWIYIAVGVVSFIYGAPLHAIHADDVIAESVRLSGIIAGAFMLRGENWARWLAIAWIAFHIGLSAFHNLRELAVQRSCQGRRSHRRIFVAWPLQSRVRTPAQFVGPVSGATICAQCYRIGSVAPRSQLFPPHDRPRTLLLPVALLAAVQWRRFLLI